MSRSCCAYKSRIDCNSWSLRSCLLRCKSNTWVARRSRSPGGKHALVSVKAASKIFKGLCDMLGYCTYMPGWVPSWSWRRLVSSCWSRCEHHSATSPCSGTHLKQRSQNIACGIFQQIFEQTREIVSNTFVVVVLLPALLILGLPLASTASRLDLVPSRRFVLNFELLQPRTQLGRVLRRVDQVLVLSQQSLNLKTRRQMNKNERSYRNLQLDDSQQFLLASFKLAMLVSQVHNRVAQLLIARLQRSKHDVKRERQSF